MKFTPLSIPAYQALGKREKNKSIATHQVDYLATVRQLVHQANEEGRPLVIQADKVITEEETLQFNFSFLLILQELNSELSITFEAGSENDLRAYINDLIGPLSRELSEGDGLPLLAKYQGTISVLNEKVENRDGRQSGNKILSSFYHPDRFIANKRILEQVFKGDAQSKIAAELNNDGLLTAQGKKYRQPRINDLLSDLKRQAPAYHERCRELSNLVYASEQGYLDVINHPPIFKATATPLEELVPKKILPENDVEINGADLTVTWQKDPNSFEKGGYKHLPFNTLLKISFSSRVGDGILSTIFNSKGEEVFWDVQRKTKANTHDNNTWFAQLDLINDCKLPPGHYYLTFSVLRPNCESASIEKENLEFTDVFSAIEFRFGEEIFYPDLGDGGNVVWERPTEDAKDDLWDYYIKPIE